MEIEENKIRCRREGRGKWKGKEEKREDYLSQEFPNSSVHQPPHDVSDSLIPHNINYMKIINTTLTNNTISNPNNNNTIPLDQGFPTGGASSSS